MDHLLKARICDIAGDLAGIVLEHNEWPEILTYSQCAIQVKKVIKFRLSVLYISHVLLQVYLQWWQYFDPIKSTSHLVEFLYHYNRM